MNIDKLEELELERKIAEKLKQWRIVIEKVKEIEKIEKDNSNNTGKNRK